MNVESMYLGRKRTDFIPAHCNIRPLRDQIILKPLAWEPSKTIEVVYGGKPLRGEVLAIGPGCYPTRQNKERTKSWSSKQFRPTDVKVGDVVELGGLEIRGYPFDELLWGNERVLICREQDVTGVVS